MDQLTSPAGTAAAPNAPQNPEAPEIQETPQAPGADAGAGAPAPDAPGRGWLAALVMATVGVAMGWFGPIQILLPAQAQAMTGGDGKEALLALVTGAGAAASMVANPLWGALSDRLWARRGTRTPVLLAGTLLGILGLLGLANAGTPGTMMVGWLAVQIGLNGPFAVLAAMIADRVPEAHRGLVGSWFGAAQMIGIVSGTGLAVACGEGPWGYVAVAVAVPLLVAPVLMVGRRSGGSAGRGGGSVPAGSVGADPAGVPRAASPGARPAAEAGPWWRGIRVNVTFAGAFCFRLLINLVSSLGLLYLYYFLQARVGIADPGTWMLVLTGLYVVISGIVAAIGGVISDQLHRRRLLAGTAAVLMAAGSLVMAGVSGIGLLLCGVVLISLGNGVFLSVDVAIVTASLPDARSRATMLGIANIGSALPQALAPALAAPIVTGLGGYPALYCGAAAVALATFAVLPMLKGIR